MVIHQVSMQDDILASQMNEVGDDFELEIQEFDSFELAAAQQPQQPRLDNRDLQVDIMAPIMTALRKLAAGQGGEDAVRSAVRAGKAAFCSGNANGKALENGTCREVTELLTWGKLSNYQLGFGLRHDEQSVPKVVRFPSSGVQIITISCSRFHSLAVASCGNVFSWGFGGSLGRLGVGESDKGDRNQILVHPTRIREFGPHNAVLKVAAGLDHSVALTQDGKMYAWGSNTKGQLGLKNEDSGIRAGTADACVKRPLQLKGPFKDKKVSDVAAGADYSLCVTCDGNAFAWGSNACGSLGLGAPPTGPELSSVPRLLPHLSNVVHVHASPSGHCSLITCTNGEALLFGGGTSSNKQGSVDARFFTPSRLRRRERKVEANPGCPDSPAVSKGPGSPTATKGPGSPTASKGPGSPTASKGPGSPAATNEWQTSRGRSAAGAMPLKSVTMGSEIAYAVDELGCIWTWSLTASRPCVAEAFEVKNAPEEGFSQVARADRLGCLWTVGGGGLWRLHGGSSSTEPCRAERYEEVDQVSFLACGPEHQAVVTSFYLEAPSTDLGAESDEKLHPECVDLACEEENAGGAKSSAQQKRRKQVPTLERLCENALCRTMSPSNLGVVCEVGLLIRSGTLLDYAFDFIQANWQLMTTEAYLPTLAQLPFDVLAAKDMAFSGQWSKPSKLFEVDPYEFPPNDWLPSSPSHNAAEAPSASPPTGPSLRPYPSTSRRRGGGGGRKRPSGTPKTSPAASTSSPTNANAVSPAGLPLPSREVYVGRPLEVSVDENLWIEVGQKGRRKASGEGSGSLTKATPSPDWYTQVYLAASPTNGNTPTAKAVTGARGGSTPTAKAVAGSDASEQSLHPLPTLSDYVVRPDQKKGNAKTGSEPPTEGPSSILQQAVQQSVCQWAEQEKDMEKPSLKQILQEEKAAAPRKSSDGAGASSNAAEMAVCSWGRDAMPSEKPKTQSVYELQKAEELRKKNAEEEKEIQEAMAMFAALEVAEKIEELEKQGLSTSELSAPTCDSASPKAKGKASAKTKDEKDKKKRQPKWGSENGEKNWWSSSSWSKEKGKGGGGWTDSSWEGEKWQGSSWQSEKWQGKQKQWNQKGKEGKEGNEGKPVSDG